MFIGLDLGTSGTKAIVFNEEGRVIKSSFRGYKMLFPRKGYIELNPEDIWRAVRFVLKEVISKTNNSNGIKALSISSFGEAFVPINHKGEVLHNSILATDIRGEEEISLLVNNLSEDKIVETTGLPISPTYSIAKILWLKSNRSYIYKNVWKFLQYQDYILYKLCGETISDYSLASRTMALDIRKRSWSEEILNAAGISMNLLPEVKPAGTIIGKIRPQMANDLSLPRSLLLVLGGHDQPCCALGAGVVTEGSAVDSVGTTECITLLLADRLQKSIIKNYNFPNEPFVNKIGYNTMAYLHTAGVLLEWFINLFAKMEKVKLEKESKDVYNYFEEISPTPPSSLFILPHFAGTGTPYMDTAAKGAIVGLTLETKKEDIYLAFLEGIAFDIQNNIECLKQAGITFNKLFVVGGGARFPKWLQMKADIFGKEISTLECNEAGALGTAILAAKATGVYNDLKTAVKSMVKVKDTIYPDKEKSEIYKEKFKEYVKLYKNLRDTNLFITNGK